MNYKMIFTYLEKFTLGIWGLTVMDLLAFIDLDSITSFDAEIKSIFAFVGLIYLLMQLPFKFMELKSKKRLNDLENDLKEQELKFKQKYSDQKEKINDALEYYEKIQ